MLGLVTGAGMGLGGLFAPKWASALVRLREDQPGGFAEFRGTYGGLFFGAHAVALALMLTSLETESLGATALGAVLACSAMWIGTGVGRVLSIAADKTNTKFNQGSVAFEIALGLAILAPWLV